MVKDAEKDTPVTGELTCNHTMYKLQRSRRKKPERYAYYFSVVHARRNLASRARDSTPCFNSARLNARGRFVHFVHFVV
jgi:hypothetical protein